MRVPNANSAVAEIRKLRDYSLNPAHRTGKHKTRVFASALGMTAGDAAALRDILLRVVVECEADRGLKDGYGQQYLVEFPLDRKGVKQCFAAHGLSNPMCPIRD